jgi:gluconolactonase
VPLRGPNDLVIDSFGGFYFTDLGKQWAHDVDIGEVYYATPDGARIEEVIAPILHPNGVGLSPDGATLYVAETQTGRLYGWQVAEPEAVFRCEDRTVSPPHGGGMLFGPQNYQLFASLAVEQGGAVCVGTLARGGVTVDHPDGCPPEFVAVPLDSYVTNICFSGTDLRWAFLTCSRAGLVVEVE